MSAQTTYKLRTDQAYAGQLADINTAEIDSYHAEGAVPFGVVVGQGTAENQVVVGAGARALGISIRSLDREGAANTGAIQYEDMDTVGVIREGKVFAMSALAVAAGDAVTYDANGVLGAAGTTLANATWEQTTSGANEMSIVRIGVGV